MEQTVEVILDEQGHLHIPAQLRHRLNLSPGMSLLVEEDEHGTLYLRPGIKEAPKVVDKQGILVVQSQSIANLDTIVKRERERRLSSLIKPIDL